MNRAPLSRKSNALRPSTYALLRTPQTLALMEAGRRVKLHLTPEERRRQMELRPAPPAIAGEEEMRKEREC